jgi:hypothetical protein
MDVALNYCSPTVVALIITIVIILASWSDFLEFTVAQFARAATNSERGERERERERERKGRNRRSIRAATSARPLSSRPLFCYLGERGSRVCGSNYSLALFAPLASIAKMSQMDE